MDARSLVIIGSGPAGLTAAIYSARAGFKPLLFEGLSAGGQPGGQLMITTDVENFPGFPEGVQGPELMGLLKRQAERFGAELVGQDVTAVDFKRRPFQIVSDDRTVTADSVIIATGARANWLGLESETALRGFGVSACATCDGFFFKQKSVVVAGGGDSAVEEATFLTRFASRVTLVHRRDALRASKIMQERLLSDPKVSVVWDSVIDRIEDPAARKVTGVVLKNVKTGVKTTLPCDGVFVAVGHTPNSKLFEGRLALDPKGYIRVHGGTATDVEGVFACGDVQDFRYRQAVTAAGSGCMAALDAQKYLEELAAQKKG